MFEILCTVLLAFLFPKPLWKAKAPIIKWLCDVLCVVEDKKNNNLLCCYFLYKCRLIVRRMPIE